MTFHTHRTPRPAAVPPAVPQPGPVTMALRGMRDALTTPPATGPVTDAIRTMRAADPDFDRSPELRALRQALADRIEADLAALDALGGDDEREADYTTCERAPDGSLYTLGRSTDDEASLCSLGGTAAGCTFASQASWAGGGYDDREDENEHGADDDGGEPNLCGLTVGHGDDLDREGGDDNGIADRGGEFDQAQRFLAMGGNLNVSWRRFA